MYMLSGERDEKYREKRKKIHIEMFKINMVHYLNRYK